MTAPVLELRDVCIESEGQRLVDSISLVSSGHRIGLRGAGTHVLSAISGDAQISAGTLRLLGVECEPARRMNLFGIARPWSATGSGRQGMTVLDGLVLSAMVGGVTRARAVQLAKDAMARLGLSSIASQRLDQRQGLSHYFAGLAEAALFDPELVVVEWPMSMLTAEDWSRYGTALSLLLNKRRWLVGISGPPRLPVEQSWVGALDQILWLEGDCVAQFAPVLPKVARYLLVLAGDAAIVSGKISVSGLNVVSCSLCGANAAIRAGYVLELPRDEFGRPSTDAVLAFCDEHQFPIVRLEPLDGVC